MNAAKKFTVLSDVAFVFGEIHPLRGRHHQAYKGTIRHLDRNAEKSGKPSLGTGLESDDSVLRVTEADCILSGYAGFPGDVIFSGQESSWWFQITNLSCWGDKPK